MNQESIQFTISFAVRTGQIHIDVPLAVMRPEIDQPGITTETPFACDRWIDMLKCELRVTCATLDAPLVEIGYLSYHARLANPS